MDETKAKAEYIKAIVINYFRKKKHFPMIALEARAKLKYRASRGDRADILAVTSANILIEVEVKTSINDLKGDIRKEIHQDILTKTYTYPVHYFCFAVLQELEAEAVPVIREMYPYAGLLVVKEHPVFHYADVRTVLNPKKIKKPPLTPIQIREMQRIMSSNICRMANKILGIS